MQTSLSSTDTHVCQIRPFQELLRKVSYTGLSLSAYMYFTKEKELWEKFVKLKQCEEFLENQNRAPKQVDYSACSNNSLGVVVEEHGAIVFGDVSLTVKITSNDASSNDDEGFQIHSFEKMMASVKRWADWGQNKMQHGK